MYCCNCGVQLKEDSISCHRSGRSVPQVGFDSTDSHSVSRNAKLRQNMKKTRVLAVVCIVVSSVLAAGVPVDFVWEPVRPHDYHAFLAQVLTAVFLVGSVFYSVRWYMTLSGRTHKVNSQAWAAILFWYSILGIVNGLFLIGWSVILRFFYDDLQTTRSIRIGEGIAAIFVLVGFPSGIWRERLRAAEKTVQASAQASAV